MKMKKSSDLYIMYYHIFLKYKTRRMIRDSEITKINVLSMKHLIIINLFD